jgi:hypothetical protein
MLSDYQYAVLAQMGITVFTDNQHTLLQAKPESESKSSNKPVTTSDAKSKISALRNSIGKSAAEKSPTETETENNASEPAKNVRQGTINPDFAMVKDVLSVADQLGISLIPAKEWHVDDAGLLKIATDTMILPAQLESFTPQQKRQLWKALVAAHSS